jgi:hypothetical protein
VSHSFISRVLVKANEGIMRGEMGYMDRQRPEGKKVSWFFVSFHYFLYPFSECVVKNIKS